MKAKILLRLKSFKDEGLFVLFGPIVVFIAILGLVLGVEPKYIFKSPEFSNLVSDYWLANVYDWMRPAFILAFVAWSLMTAAVGAVILAIINSPLIVLISVFPEYYMLIGFFGLIVHVVGCSIVLNDL